MFGLLLVAVTAWAEGRQQKLALLIQNDAYPDSDRARAVDEDAATLAAALRRNGFEVELRRNASRLELRSAVDAFVARVTPGSVALVYYKGIGIQASRLDYLVPVDAAIWSEEDLKRDGTSLDHLLSDLDGRGAGVKIAIVDAARPNPFERRFRMVAAGLAPTSAPRGSLVIFAEALNRVAEPGKGPVSPFMGQLARQIEAAGDAETAFARTRERVAKLSDGRELPWVSSTLAEPFSFSRAASAEPAPQPQVSQPVGKPSAASAPSKPPEIIGPPPVPPDKPAAQQVAAAPRPGSPFSDCRNCPEMTIVPAASFEMGSGTTPFDRPVHKVTIARPFAISLAPVTREEWTLCETERGCPSLPKGEGAAGGDYPVVGVSWADAVRYAAFLSRKTGQRYRLPTEAEWEYAARGGTTTAFAWGDAVGTGHANCADCGGTGRAGLQPVKRYPKNGFGLFDMAGNAAQWLEDCWRLTYRDAPTDGSAPAVASCDLRVARGGSFETTSAYVKPTARFRYPADTRSRSLGFRVVRDVH